MTANDVSPMEAIYLHNKMVLKLSRKITEKELDDLKCLFQDNPLSEVDLNKIKTVQHLFNQLKNKTCIAYGRYEDFLPKLELINPDLCSIVNKCTDDIGLIIQQTADEGKSNATSTGKTKSINGPLKSGLSTAVGHEVSQQENVSSLVEAKTDKTRSAVFDTTERMVISMDKAEYRASEGSTAYILCSVDPKADSITWNKGHEGPPSTRIPIDNRKYFSGWSNAPTLVINQATKAIDEAHYQCIAKANSTVVDGKIVHLEVYTGDDYGQPLSSKSSSSARGSPLLKNTDPTAEVHSQYIGTQDENMLFQPNLSGGVISDLTEFGVNDQGSQLSFVIKNKTDAKRPDLVPDISNGFAVATNANERVKDITFKPQCILVCIDITPARSLEEPSSVHLAKQFRHYILDGGRIQLSDESRTILDIDEATFEITPHNARQGVRPYVNISHGMFTVPVGGSAILQTYMYLIAPPVATSIQWFKMKSNQQMAIEIDNEKYFGGSDLSPTLIIRNATIDDQGLYLCWATNKFGTGSSSTSFILIQSAVTLETPKMIRLESKTGEEPRSKDSIFATLPKQDFDPKTLAKKGRIKTKGSPSDITENLPAESNEDDASKCSSDVEEIVRTEHAAKTASKSSSDIEESTKLML